MFKYCLRVILFFLFISKSLFAQNLVENGSLEEFPKDILPNKVYWRINEPVPVNWTFINTVDLYYSGVKSYWCCKPANNVAPDGTFYAGLILYTSNQRDYREYAIGKLKTPLVKGRKYVVSLNIQFDNWSTNIVDYLHLFFLRSLPVENSKAGFDIHDTVNVIKLQMDSILFKNWFLYTDTITAEGNELGIALGNLVAKDSSLVFIKKSDNHSESKKKKGNELMPNPINLTPIVSYIFFDQFSLEEIKEGKNDSLHNPDIITLNSIRFKFDDTLYLTQYADTLKLLIDTLRNSPLDVLLTGYTDNLGDYDYNLLLSKKRANAIKNFLLKSGVDSKKISIDYKSYFNPVSSNKSEAERSYNRRVEIALRKKKPD